MRTTLATLAPAASVVVRSAAYETKMDLSVVGWLSVPAVLPSVHHHRGDALRFPALEVTCWHSRHNDQSSKPQDELCPVAG